MEWEAVLSKAVEQGLSDAAAGFLGAPGRSADLASEPELHEDVVESMMVSVRLRIQAATGRSVRLLQTSPDATVLTTELEAWLIEAGRLEVAMEEALAVGNQAVALIQEERERERSEHHACKRAFELHLAQTSLEGKRRAQLETQAARERELERQQLTARFDTERETLQADSDSSPLTTMSYSPPLTPTHHYQCATHPHSPPLTTAHHRSPLLTPAQHYLCAAGGACTDAG